MKYPLITLLLALASTTSHASGPSWDYTNASDWGTLAPEYQLCTQGRSQSPIDIRQVEKTAAAPLRFDYRPGGAELVNNGHTIQANLAGGNRLQLAEGGFELVQLHFHTPSEERISGRRYPLVAHLVHKNERGELAVVAVLFRTGRNNPALAPLFSALPAQAGATQALPARFDPATLLPKQRDYYAYTGSLTTPPCSEGVRWRVLKQPVELSKQQLAAFQRLYPMNARPVQPLHGRTVLESGL